MFAPTQRIESSLRRKASRLGLTVVKIRETDRFYVSHGPYLLVDRASNCVVIPSLSRDELIREIDAL